MGVDAPGEEGARKGWIGVDLWDEGGERHA